MTAPAHRYLSLGAGVQSTTLLLLAAQGRIPTFDAAILWERPQVPSAAGGAESWSEAVGQHVLELGCHSDTV